MNNPKKTILDEHAAGFILGELSDEEFRALCDSPAMERTKSLNECERIASLVALADADQNEPMPEKLRDAVTATGRSLVAEWTAKPVVSVGARASQGRLRETVAWLACLAASIIAILFWQNPRREPEQAATPPLTRESLIASASDLIQVRWSEGKTPWEQKVTGDVVWSNKMQRGFMRFVGMPVNDPTIEQYQLWIIDPSRDDEPVDGGVFDISATGEIIVPIQAKLRVNQPTAFAVTIEKPGGVVVSTQERLPLLATVAKKKWIRTQIGPSDLPAGFSKVE